MKFNNFFNIYIICAGWCVFSFPIYGQSLEYSFKNPPASAKPKTWMHAMSSNMSKEGLTKDLESIKKVGIGGVLLFNITQGIPNGPVKYNSAEHHEMLKHAAVESERLGLSFGVHNCDGWTSSGGPWIKPEQSMKMLVYSEILSKGGTTVSLQLPQPTMREGFYKDIAVIAYPSLASEIADKDNVPIITASDSGFNGALANDGKIDRGTTVKMVGKTKPWIQYEYKVPQTIRSAYMVFIPGAGEAELQFSNDGKIFKSVKKLMKVRTGKGEWGINDNFAPVTARFFRLQLSEGFTIKEANILATYCLQNVLGRTGMARTEDVALSPIGTPESAMIIDKENIIDLTASMDAKGMLKTKLPKGNWTIMRFGYTATGAFNWPASDEGRGLECDKFSKKAIELHYNSFVKRLVNNAKKEAPNALQYVEIDSYEMGGQNWTDGYETVFKERNGYELTKFLPVYAGRFVEDAATTDAVLWDIRNLSSDLMTENYYGYFTELCHRDGLKTYFEPYGFGPLNNLDIGGKADINMGEFWMNRPLQMDQIAPAVSASHIYGKEITSAESFTTTPGINWKGNPAMAKSTGDKAWAVGINEFMFHRFAHQANPNVKPGMTMNRWGFHFDRTQTWWENAGADWFQYIARGSYLLRQGVPVSDLLVFVGDGSPNSIFERENFEPSIPIGTNFDCVNADVLYNRIRIKDKQLVLPEGTTYKMLVLKNTDKISLKTLKRIYEISKQGVPIVGLKPTKLAGYLATKEDKMAFDKMSSAIWDSPKTYAHYDWKKIMDAEHVLPDFKVKDREDMTFMHRQANGKDIYFFYNPDSIPRQFEIKFRVAGKIPELWNQMTGEIKKSAHFAQTKEQITAWITLDGLASTFVVFQEPSKDVVSITQAGAKPFTTEYVLDDNNKLVLLAGGNGSLENILSTGEKIKTTVTGIPKPFEIKGPWNVEFLKKDDYQAQHVFATLTDWKDNPIDEIQHYSGTAIYRNTFKFDPAELDVNNKYILDLGEVKIVAVVKLNGKLLGIKWIAPFELDITPFLKAGENQLEIEITNQWTNRLIGDERYPVSYTLALEGNFPKKKMPDWYVKQQSIPAGKRTTFCTATFYKATDALMPSGLLGPVQIKVIKKY